MGGEYEQPAMSEPVDRQPGAGRADDALPGGGMYSWWRGDPIPELSPLPGFRASRAGNPAILGRLFRADRQQVEARIRGGNVPYMAYIGGEPAAYGWSAWRRGRIGELGMEFNMPEDNRYLWDFLTVPHLRGRGIYPRLLQAILAMERGEAERFWIGHGPGNPESGRGIVRAGFRPVGEVRVYSDQPVLVAYGDRIRAAAAASLLQIPLLAES